LGKPYNEPGTTVIPKMTRENAADRKENDWEKKIFHTSLSKGKTEEESAKKIARRERPRFKKL